MDLEVRKELAKKPITWTGDLQDDCSAIWAGLLLRAEWMDEDNWWWAVTDQSKDFEIGSSNHFGENCIGGENARKRAEETARHYINELANTPYNNGYKADRFSG